MREIDRNKGVGLAVSITTSQSEIMHFYMKCRGLTLVKSQTDNAKFTIQWFYHR